MRGQDKGDYATALQEWRPLAEQGLAQAQNNLGSMYARGEGVPEDYVKAYMWWSLAKAQGHNHSADNLDIVKKEMNTDQIGEPQKLATKMWEKINN